MNFRRPQNTKPGSQKDRDKHQHPEEVTEKCDLKRVNILDLGHITDGVVHGREKSTRQHDEKHPTDSRRNRVQARVEGS